MIKSCSGITSDKCICLQISIFSPLVPNVFHFHSSYPTKKQKEDTNSRAILVASVEDHEGVGFSKEVLFIQFVGTELHGSIILQKKRESQRNEKTKKYRTL